MITSETWRLTNIEIYLPLPAPQFETSLCRKQKIIDQ